MPNLKVRSPRMSIVMVAYSLLSDSQTLPQPRLEREYAFHLVISAFLRAIRTGAIKIEHSAVLLGHYGRVSSVYDQCTKVIIEVLREEGMYGGNAETVGRVLINALQEVSCSNLIRASSNKLFIVIQSLH